MPWVKVRADSVLESLWLAHGDTLLTVTDIVRIVLCLDPSGNEQRLMIRIFRVCRDFGCPEIVVVAVCSCETAFGIRPYPFCSNWLRTLSTLQRAEIAVVTNRSTALRAALASRFTESSKSRCLIISSIACESEFWSNSADDF